jgi:signal transduction histidine kinase
MSIPDSSSAEQDETNPSPVRVRSRRSARAELLRKTVGIAAASHELRTPLSLLSGYTKLLLAGSLGELSEQQQKVLTEMDAAADRMQRYVNDFLAFGALESGKLCPDRQLQSVNKVVREIVEIWTPRFVAAGKVLTFLPGTDLPPALFDALKIQHVFSNLLDNALRFTPEGGEVTITTRPHIWDRRMLGGPSSPKNERRKEPSRKDNAVRVDIRDMGPGIPAEYHSQVFEEFQRLPISRNSEGAGLGLAIAKRLVVAHGGRIWIESGVSQGAIFSFLLPTST